MTIFVVPIVGTGARGDARRPKYISDIAGLSWSMADFDGTAIVWANTDASQETSIGANPDALVVPPLDNTVAVTATKNALEALNIPAQWITAAMTYRAVCRVIVGFAQLWQRMQGLGFTLTIAGNLDKTMSQLSAALRQALSDAADSLGLDHSTIIGSTTVREALRICGQQFVQNKIIVFGDL